MIVIPLFLGIGTFTMTMMPGTPSIQNVVPTKYLGTTLTSAPLIGVIASIVATFAGLWYMRRTLKKSLAKNEVFEAADDKDKDKNIELKENIPSFLLSIFPIVVMIIIIFIGSVMEIENIVLVGLGAAVVISAIVFYKYIPSHKEALSLGANGSINPIFFTSASVAFGVVITLAPGFKVISDLILGIPGNPLISLSIASSVLGAITGSASGGLGIAMEAFAESYLAMGINQM